MEIFSHTITVIILQENVLGFTGGKTVHHVVRRVLEKVLTNKLAERYNWTGRYNKSPLKDLCIIRIIQSKFIIL